MKPTVFIIILFSLLSLNAAAQEEDVQVIDLKDVLIHNGDSVSVKGNVFGFTNGPLGHTYLLAVGNDFPNPVIKVWIVNIRSFQYYPAYLKNIGKVTFEGKLENHAGEMWMTIYRSAQILLTPEQWSLLTKAENEGKKWPDPLIKPAQTTKNRAPAKE
jgi:hypothetical protein